MLIKVMRLNCGIKCLYQTNVMHEKVQKDAGTSTLFSDLGVWVCQDIMLTSPIKSTLGGFQHCEKRY